MSSSALGRRAFVALAAVFAASLAVDAGDASADRVDPPGRQDANHCFFFTGVDLNDLFGVPEQFRDFLCREVSAGEHWRPFAPWITDDGVDSVYPAGYVPLRPRPIEDFVAKLTVKVVTMPRMKPLSVGAHSYEVTWVLSAQHCDGYSTVVEESCLPAGELPIDGGPLTVTPPAH